MIIFIKLLHRWRCFLNYIHINWSWMAYTSNQINIAYIKRLSNIFFIDINIFSFSSLSYPFIITTTSYCTCHRLSHSSSLSTINILRGIISRFRCSNSWVAWSIWCTNPKHYGICHISLRMRVESWHNKEERRTIGGGKGGWCKRRSIKKKNKEKKHGRKNILERQRGWHSCIEAGLAAAQQS